MNRMNQAHIPLLLLFIALMILNFQTIDCARFELEFKVNHPWWGCLPAECAAVCNHVLGILAYGVCNDNYKECECRLDGTTLLSQSTSSTSAPTTTISTTTTTKTPLSPLKPIPTQ